MFRKIVLATVATAALGAAALAPTSASAWGFHPYWGGGWHGGWYGPRIVVTGPVYDGCSYRAWVQTASGPQLRWVNRCY